VAGNGTSGYQVDFFYMKEIVKDIKIIGKMNYA